jgi:serine/threonine protein kinase
MTPADSHELDDRAVELLAEYHAALLAVRQVAGAAGGSAGLEEGDRLERLRACLCRLEEDRSQRAESAAWAACPRVGRFELLGELGRGSHGIVFLARDPVLCREVALKVPRPEALLNPALRQRFLREARAAATLAHPNIVAIHEAGEDARYIASAYCPGPTLASWLKQQPGLMAPRTAAAIAAALADAMHHAHERGVLHRDLKPSNILLQCLLTPDPAPVPQITDFGLAKLLECEEESTRTGAILGTPCYMAPEQALGHAGDIGPATDVYGLGAILYEMLTGRPPFKSSTVQDTLDQVRNREPAPPSGLHPQLPRDLEAICLRCLRKDPTGRYRTARALADDLRRFLQGEPIRARPPSLGARLGTILWSARAWSLWAALGVLLAMFAVVAVSQFLGFDAVHHVQLLLYLVLLVMMALVGIALYAHSCHAAAARPP